MGSLFGSFREPNISLIRLIRIHQPADLVKPTIEQLVEPGRATVGLKVSLHHLGRRSSTSNNERLLVSIVHITPFEAKANYHRQLAEQAVAELE